VRRSWKALKWGIFGDVYRVVVNVGLILFFHENRKPLNAGKSKETYLLVTFLLRSFNSSRFLFLVF
jgi:hypothetical protein